MIDSVTTKNFEYIKNNNKLTNKEKAEYILFEHGATYRHWHYTTKGNRPLVSAYSGKTKRFLINNPAIDEACKLTEIKIVIRMLCSQVPFCRHEKVAFYSNDYGGKFNPFLDQLT